MLQFLLILFAVSDKSGYSIRSNLMTDGKITPL
jgi:hypothetical protein